MHKIRLLPFLMAFVVLAMGHKTPKEEAQQDLHSYDISSYGVPITVMAPEGAEVSKSELGSMEFEGIKVISVDIEKDMFIMNVSLTDVELEGETVSDLSEFYLETISEEPGFEIISQEDAGFIYKTEDPDIGLDYSFAYFMIKNNKEVYFTAGLSLFDNFKLEHVEAMFAAAKQAK